MAFFFKTPIFLLFPFLIAFMIRCATSSSVQTEVLNKVNEHQKKVLSEYTAEVDIGRNMAGRLLNFYGVVEDQALIKYVNEVGSFVGTVSDHPERHYMFAILESEMVNAFACPGGYILVTQGSLRQAENEAELAAILGHEVAHVGEKHMFNTLIKSKNKELANENKNQQSDESDEAKMRERPKLEIDKSATGDILARYLSGATNAGASLLQAAKDGMGLILEKGLDKNLEFQADALGTRYAIRAGYKPDALYQFLARLEKNKRKRHVDTSVLDKTHPKLSERRKKIASLLTELNAKQIVGASVRERFQKFHEMLPPPKNK